MAYANQDLVFLTAWLEKMLMLRKTEGEGGTEDERV